jgi:alpha-L-fucosidase
VKSAEKLFEIYLTSVGRGSTLLLNIPPDQRGLIHENDLKSLRGLKQILEKEFASNLAKNAKATSEAYRGSDDAYDASKTTDEDPTTYWTTDDGTTTGSLEIDLGQTTSVKYIQLQEYIELGQRIKAFTIEALVDDRWISVAKGTTVGYKRILKIDPVVTNKIRVIRTDAKACPRLAAINIY